MKHNPNLVYYVIAVFLLSVLLKAVGLIDFSVSEYSGYVLIFYGIVLVINHFGKYERLALFSGSSIFLIGIFLLLMNYFEFSNLRLLYLPSIMFICSAGFLILFLEDTKYFLAIVLSVAFLGAAIAVIYSTGRLDVVLFIRSLWNVITGYWAVFLVAAVIVFLWWRRA